MGFARCTTVAALATLLMAASLAPAVAQDVVSRPAVDAADGVEVFGTLGLGVASEGVGGVLSLSRHSSRNVFGLRASGASEFEILSPSDSAEDYALLFGRVHAGRGGWVRAAIGPAVVRARRFGRGYDCSWFVCSSYEEQSTTTLGLALQTDAVWALGRTVGLGLTGFGSVNPEMSYAGLALALHLGMVRRR
jgi:hypothetical protein